MFGTAMLGTAYFINSEGHLCEISGKGVSVLYKPVEMKEVEKWLKKIGYKTKPTKRRK